MTQDAGDLTHRVIAIDGPAASGKSTVSRRLAAGLGYLYVDSGAVYRGITWKALQDGISCRDDARVKELLARLSMEFYVQEGAVRYRIDGIDPGQGIRTQQVDENVSPIAAMPEVRTRVTNWLRDMRKFGNLVMEGRDIGTVVFPDAERKFYLNASAEVRAQRRHAELVARQEVSHAEDVANAILVRDRIDSTRKKDPLRIAAEAIQVDSTGMSIDQVVAFIRERIADSNSR
jgi:cytidylate kinase